jgi:hypothetical protein
MSMESEQEHLPDVVRLLALKRHEQPPPGYFNGFSEQVIARIRAGERIQDDILFERLGWQVPWLQRLWTVFENQPALAGVFGVAVCGLLVAAVVYSQSVEPAPVTLFMPGVEQPAIATAGVQPVNSLLTGSAFDLSSTGGVVSLPGHPSIFESLGQPRPQLINYPAPTGN